MYDNKITFFLLGIIGLTFLLSQNANAVIQVDPYTDYLSPSPNVYIPYQLIQNSSSVTVNSLDGSLFFNKNICSGSYYQSTSLNVSPSIPSDTYSVLSSVNGSGVWSPVNIINNAACTTTVSNTTNSVTVLQTKSVAGAGTFTLNYTKQINKPIKLTFSATNSNPAWTNRQIGLEENLAVPKIVTLGNQTYDLSQFNNTVLNRNWINNHHAQLIHFTPRTYFDMGIGWNHVNTVKILWINNQAYLQIDYTYNTPILSPGQTITIDPSITTDTITSPTVTGAGTTNATQNISITIGSNTNRVIIVGISYIQTTSKPDVNQDGISSVKIGGLSFTKAVNSTRANATLTIPNDAEIWYLVNPPTGAQHITITPTLTSTYEMIASAYSLYNVSPTPIGATASNGTTTRTSSISITPTHPGAWLIENIEGISSTGTGGAAPSLNSTTKAWSNNISAGDISGASEYNRSPTINSVNKLSWQWASPTTARSNIADVVIELLPSAVPATPSLTNVNTINSTSINPTWTAPAGATWFWLNSTLSGGSTSHINTTSTSYKFNNMTAGSKYTFSLVAANSTGKSASSLTKYNYTKQIAPTSPSISSITTSQARLSWTNPSGNVTSGFKFFTATPNTGTYTLAGTSSNSTTHFDLTGLLGNQQYIAKISSRYAVGTNYTGVSANSTTVSFYTLPNAPTSLTATQTSPLMAHLNWSAATDNGTVNGYFVEQSIDGGSTWTTLSANTGNTTTHYDKLESAAGKFKFRVSSIKYGGTSAPSNVASLTVYDTFTYRAFHHDGTTATYGQVIQANTTSSNNRFALVSGAATINGISNLNNFTAWNSIINFIVGRNYNVNTTSTHSLNVTTADFDVDCPSTGTGIDVEVWTNGTNGHNITTFTTPTCYANNTMKWSTKFTANGNDAHSYNTQVYVRAVNATFGTTAPLKYNQTIVTTSFTDPFITSNSVTVGTGLQTKLFNWSMNLTVSPAFTPVNFTVGHISVSGVNPVTAPIKFSTNTINSSATAVTVTFPSTYTMGYQLTFGNEGSSHTYTGLPVTSPSLGLGQSVLTFRNPGNDLVTIKAYDITSNTTARYILAQPNNDIPFVTQIKNFKNGLLGTSAMIGGIDMVSLIILIVAMIGLNRANEIVGAIMMVVIIGVCAFFGIFDWPTTMVAGIALTVLVIVSSQKKLFGS